MATGAEHYAQAERLLGAVGGARGLLTNDGVPEVTPDLIAAAHVHALLAGAAAAAANTARPGEYGRPVVQRPPTAHELLADPR